jgi:hypothetical protein
LLPSRWWTVRRFGGGPFLTPQNSQRHPAWPRTHLDILPQRGGYSFRRSGAAPFTVPTPETTAANEFFTTTDACLVRVHAGYVGGCSVEKEQRLLNAFERSGQSSLFPLLSFNGLRSPIPIPFPYYLTGLLTLDMFWRERGHRGASSLKRS